MAADSGSGPVNFQVDTERLRALQSKINAVRRDLLDVQTRSGVLGSASRGAGAAGSCGVHEIDRAINDFIRQWTYGREVIEDELNDLVALIGGAVESYAAAEQANTVNG